MFDFDSDGAAATHSAALHCDAYNAAFYELGLRWHWDHTFYQAVLNHAEERARIRRYLESHQAHLLKAYEAEFLVDAIEAAQARCLAIMTASGRRSGTAANWAEIQQHQVGT